MGERASLPHDRGHLLWTAEDGPSRLLTGSMDRWVTAILGDDGIDGPLMGFGEKRLLESLQNLQELLQEQQWLTT